MSVTALDVHARERMQEARDVIEGLVAENAVVYGVTTGFGDLATTFIDGAPSARKLKRFLNEDLTSGGSGISASKRPWIEACGVPSA